MFIILKTLKKKINKQVIYLNLIAVLLFGILYYIQDKFIINNIKTSKQLGLLKETYEDKMYNENSSPFLYHLWFSLITQTTVGYTGLVNQKTGDNIPFDKSPNRVFQFLNILQLISVFIIFSMG